MEPNAAQNPRWWQWPTVLSLDAPLVAILWQWLIARSAGAGVRCTETAVLGLSVWLAYAADRWFEGWRLSEASIRTQRHRFYQRYKKGIAVLWAIILATDVVVAVLRLPGRELKSGFVLLGAVLLYLLSHQLFHRNHPWRVPKELCVALLLGAGAALFPASRTNWHRMEIPVGLFILLCLANCALISAWEHAVDLSHGQTSLALQFRRGAAVSRALPWLIAAVSLVMGVTGGPDVRPAGLCAAASGLLLGAVDRAEPRMGRRAARVLADVALLTPLVPYVLERL